MPVQHPPHLARPDVAAAFRAEAWDAGWRPVALFSWDCGHAWVKPDARGKRPKGDAWQDRARLDPPEAADAAPELDALETGILCDGLRALDLDIDDAPTVATLRAMAVAMFGETIVRHRDNSPRVLMPYRAAEGTPEKRILAGRLGKIEVLGLGQQFAAAEHHPSGAVLRWTPEGPATTPLHTLPAITEAQLDAFLAAAAPLIGAKPDGAATPGAAGGGAAHQSSPHGAGADPLDVVAALACIPNGEAPNWEWWNKVGLATWAATGGSLSGCAAWFAWSEKNASHDAGACRERWNHYTRHRDRPQQVGAGTLFHLAREARPGWRKPSSTVAASAGAPAPMGPPEMGFLSRTRLPAPPIPLDSFGPWWAPWIACTAAGANAPPDYTAAPLLAAASALIGNARWARGWQGWFEPPSLWCASVGNPSSGKSPGAAPVMREVMKLVESHMARGYPEELAAWTEADKVAELIDKQWERDVAAAIKAGNTLPPKPREASRRPAPVKPRAKVSDATVEALAALLHGLPKGVLHVRDELAGWLLNLQRYSGGSDRPFWLESYVGGPYTVDRLKNPVPIFIPRLAVATFGTIQPDRLDDALTGVDDGLAGRFLWTWPDPHPFRRPTSASDAPAAALRLQRLANLAMPAGADGEPCPAFVSLDTAAANLLERFGQEMQAGEEGTHGLLRSSMGKARGQALRLALVLQLLWWCAEEDKPEPSSIGAEAMEAAAGLMRSYFLPMAARVLGDASVPAEERHARTLAEWIIATRPAVVNVSSIRDGARLPGLRETEPVKAACRFLGDARWLALAGDPGKPGRPRGDWTVNPLLWAAAP